MWTYIKQDDKGEYLPGESGKFPPEGESFQAFDTAGWQVSWGVMEQGRYISMYPRAQGAPGSDAVRLIAFAPWGESSSPDLDMIRASVPPAAFLAYNTRWQRIKNRLAALVATFADFYVGLRPEERGLVKVPFAALGGGGFILLLCHLPDGFLGALVAVFALLGLLVFSAILGPL